MNARSAGWAAIAWLLVLPWAAWAIVRSFELVDGQRAIELLAFTPYAALTSVVPLVLALVLRRWAAAAVAAAAVLLLAVAVVPRAVPGQSTQVAEGAPLRLLSINLDDGGADAAEVADLVREHQVSVLSIQEPSAETDRRLRAAGIREPGYGRFAGTQGTAIYSRDRAVPLSHEPDAALAEPTLGVRLWVAGRPIDVFAPHPPSPTNADKVAVWENTLATLPPADDRTPLRIQIGDFNATLDHAQLRDLIGTGYVDAADAVGAGLSGTYPAGSTFPPPIAIDHALVDERIEVTGLSVHDVAGTDHRAVLVELIIPRAVQSARR
jgi:endonuclease/exonuclease/phosphatase (EEP) superfamily protein YafD